MNPQALWTLKDYPHSAAERLFDALQSAEVVTGTRLDNACNEIDQRCLLRMISSVCWAPTSAKKLAVRSQPRQS